MDAYDFTKPVHTQDGTLEEGYCFGIDDAGTVKTLRKIANLLEQKKIAIQSCRVISTAKNEEFASSCLRVSFYEKRSKKTVDDIVKELSAILPLKTTPEDFKENLLFAHSKRIQLGIRDDLRRLYGSAQFPETVVRVDSIKVKDNS